MAAESTHSLAAGYSGPVGLCVIVAGYEAIDTLEKCLRALMAQSEVSDVIVVDCSATNPARSFGFDFPKVQFVHFDGIRTIPELRWAGMQYAEGGYVAWIEASMIPGDDWAHNMIEAHAATKTPAMIGGAIAFGPDRFRLWQWACYCCEYSHVAMGAGGHGSRSGANVSFRLGTLRELASQVENRWEDELESCWVSAGYQVGTCGAEVQFEPTLDFADSTRQRFYYGRDFGALRANGVRRAFYALVSPAIPAVILARLLGRAVKRGCFWRFVRSLPATIWFSATWALGEAVGYWFGHSKQRHID